MQIKYRGELIELVNEFNLPKFIVEVGVAEGRFAEEIYKWDIDELWLVDLWETMPFIDGCASFDQQWHDANYKRVKELFEGKKDVFIMKGFSHKIAESIPDESMGLIYIDSDHSYGGCKSDVKSWWPKLVPGGIMAFHDYGDWQNYGVNRAVIEHVKGEVNVNVIPEDGQLSNIGAWIRK